MSNMRVGLALSEPAPLTIQIGRTKNFVVQTPLSQTCRLRGCCSCARLPAVTRSAETGRFAAHWASLADTVPTLRERHPGVVAVLLRHAEALRSESRTGCIVPGVSAALRAESCLKQAGFDAPFWPALLDNRPASGQAVRSFGDLLWWPSSRVAAGSHGLSGCRCVRKASSHLLPDLDQASRALLLSQAGLAALAPSPCFPPPRSSACPRIACVSCCSGVCASRCPVRPDVVVVVGPWMPWVITRHHRAACPTAGVLGRADGRARSSEQQLAFAKRPEHGWQQMWPFGTAPHQRDLLAIQGVGRRCGHGQLKQRARMRAQRC